MRVMPGDFTWKWPATIMSCEFRDRTELAFLLVLVGNNDKKCLEN